MATTTSRKTVSIYDYPEHLNPFREDDNHNKIRFWTIGRKLNRSNSINFSGIKELKNSWAFRSFMRKGKKASAVQDSKPQTNGVHGDSSSPVVFRRALQYSTAANSGAMSGSRTTIGSPERPDRYVYGGSVTPLPRSRFQERLRSPSQQEVSSLRGTSLAPGLARSDVTGSQLSVQSTNPFDDGAPVPPVRASRRKKKKAPLPPSLSKLGDVSVTSIETETKDANSTMESEDLENETPNIELRIVEDDEECIKKNEDAENGNSEARTEVKETSTDVKKTNDVKYTTTGTTVKETIIEEKEEVQKTVEEIKKTETSNTPQVETSQTEVKQKEIETKETKVENEKSDSEDDFPAVPFPKVDIITYRRNSSLNEDDFKLRRGIPDHEVSNKRSKSLTSGINSSYVTYDINLNENLASYNEPQKVVCKLYDTPRKPSLDTSITSTEKEFIEIDRATRELEREISKLNSALVEDDNDVVQGTRLSVSDIKKKFDNNNFITSPNPIPKPRRSNYGSNSPINGNY